MSDVPGLEEDHPAGKPAVTAHRSGMAWARWLALGLAFTGVAIALRLIAFDAERRLMPAIVLAVAISMFALVVSRSWLPVGSFLVHTVPAARRARVETPLWLVAPATVMTVMAASRQYDAWGGPAGWDVGAPWLAGIALFGLAAWWPARRDWLRRPAWLNLPVRTVLPGVLLALLALCARVLWPGRHPTMIDGDEGFFLRMAVEARSGQMANPFASGWLEAPNLYPAAIGWLTHLTGPTLAGYRALGALLGTITVIATWQLGRRIVGEPAALAGAALLAVLPFHLYYSRSALIHVTDPATLMLALLFLWHAVHRGRTGDAWLAGLVVGLGWYGYWGARVFPAIVLALLAIAATDRRVGLRRAVVLGTWSAIGFLAATAPLLMTFVRFPPAFRGRFDLTSLSSRSSWKDDPTGTSRWFAENLWEAALLPFVDNTWMFYRHEAPFLGWPMALLVAAGLGAWLAAVWRPHRWRSALWLVVPWAVLILGVALTYRVEAQRLAVIAPFWSLAAGSGVVLAAWYLTRLPIAVPRASLVRSVLTTALVVALAAANLRWFLSEERLLDTYGDPYTVAAWDLGWRLGTDGAPVLFAGPPFMFAGAWANMAFLAPEANLTDIEGPLDPAAAPELPPGTLLVLVPQRAGEQCAIQAAYPDVTISEVRAGNGDLLYLAFFRTDVHGWSMATSPANTTVTIVDPAPCDSVG